MIPGLRSSDCKTPAARWVRRLLLGAGVVVVGAMLLGSMLRRMAVGDGGDELFLAKSQLRLLGMNLEAYRLMRGGYPSQEDGLRVLVSERLGKMKFGRGSAEQLLRDPWGGEVLYRMPGVLHPEGYDLLMMGPDGVVGGGDDLTNP